MSSAARTLALAFASALIALPVAAQVGNQGPPRGVLTGTVVSSATGETLARAEVTIAGTNAVTVTDDLGRFTLTGLAPGPVPVRVRALGYRLVNREIIMPDDRGIDVILTMDPVPQQVDPVRTVGTAEERERFERGDNMGVMIIGGKFVKSVPSIGEVDVLRTVQLLPGVVARSDFTAGYNVRGGESDQNLVLLDGIPIYNPFHFGGLFGTFLEPTVGDVTLHVGGFPAEYGGRLSSVLDVRSVEEERTGLHGTAGVSLLASSLTLGRAHPTRGFSWTIAGRRTYADALASLFSDRALPYHFQDAQLHATKQLPRGATLSVTAYAGIDELKGNFAELSDSSSPGGGQFRFDWGNQVAGATLTVPIGESRDAPGEPRAVLTQRLSFSRFATTLDLGSGSLGFDNRVNETRVSGSLATSLRGHVPTIGYEASFHRLGYTIDSDDSNVSLFDLRQRPTAFSLHAEDRWSPTEDLRVRVGARAEHIGGQGWQTISPRLSATYFVSPDLSVSVAGGQYTQWMHGLRNEDIPIRIFDFWIGSDKFIEVSAARDAVLGVERWFSNSRMIRVETFLKRYGSLLEPNPNDDPAIRGDEFLNATGTSYGVDVLLRQIDRGSLGGWIAYTYGVSTRRRLNDEYFPAQDRRHNLNAVMSYALGTRTTLGARFGFGTGLPFTDIVGQIVRRSYEPSTNSWTVFNSAQPFEAVGGERNASRYPTFQRLDLMLSRRYTRGRTTITPYLQVVNAYNRKNVFIYTFDYTGNPPEREATSQFPFLPSIGLTVEF